MRDVEVTVRRDRPAVERRTALAEDKGAQVGSGREGGGARRGGVSTLQGGVVRDRDRARRDREGVDAAKRATGKDVPREPQVGGT